MVLRWEKCGSSRPKFRPTHASWNFFDEEEAPSASTNRIMGIYWY